jgi:hypothetical protein
MAGSPGRWQFATAMQRGRCVRVGGLALLKPVAIEDLTRAFSAIDT